MKIYCNGKNYDLYNGSMLDLQEYIKPNSIDSIVTDPPYELGFMGKTWDSTGIAFQKETWQKLLTVMKPGGYLLAFGGSRTFHRIACAIEDAGFEIRDTILWIYGSGFPKSQNVGLEVCKKLGGDPVRAGQRVGTFIDYKQNGKNVKEAQGINKLAFGSVSNAPRTELTAYKGGNEWDGWGTCLKPAFEPIIVARKPMEGSTADNIIKWGTGALNIDGCRVPMSDNEPDSRVGTDAVNNSTQGFWRENIGDGDVQLYKDNGRFPANVILTYDETDKDEVCGGMPDSGNGNGGLPYNYFGRQYNNKETSMFNGDMPKSNSNYNDSGSASRYFYCAKASKADREEGLEDEIGQAVNDGRKTDVDNPFQRGTTIRKNIHPTVKPTELMRYLVRLVTPPGGIVLDPFNGSGSTGKAVMIENNNKGSNYRYIGIELDENYCVISRKRIDWASGYISEEETNTSETRDYKKSRVGYTPKSLF